MFPTVRRAAKAAWYAVPGSVRQLVVGGLKEEILALESRKSDLHLIELEGCPSVHRSAWRGLTSLAYEIVREYRPRVIVELGSYVGLSTFAMGVALRDLGYGGRIFAVDTWEGDPHTKRYGEDVYQGFMACRERLRLQDVVVPLRMTFAEARERVGRSIDLLHIDGWHTWKAVTTDFATYRPLLAPGALVMFHDVRTHFPEMRRFWWYVALRYESYRVPYSHGLGIIRVGRPRPWAGPVAPAASAAGAPAGSVADGVPGA